MCSQSWRFKKNIIKTKDSHSTYIPSFCQPPHLFLTCIMQTTKEVPERDGEFLQKLNDLRYHLPYDTLQEESALRVEVLKEFENAFLADGTCLSVQRKVVDSINWYSLN